MNDFGYPGLAAHLEGHAAMFAELCAFAYTFFEGRMKHPIRSEDLAFAAFLRATGRVGGLA